MNLKNKKVLVTGAGGFIGSHLAERLVRDGAKVRAFVHYNALGKRGWLDHSDLASKMEFHAGDIADRGSVEKAMEGVDCVFHLAALIAIPYSYEALMSYVRTNIEGTLNIVETARKFKTGRIVHTSTSETYGTALYVPIDEKHPLQGQSPYSASKIGADKIAESFHLSFGVPVVTVRPFNTFGPRQSARAVIPTIITQCLSGHKEIKLGSLHPTRDLNFVSDTVDGFVKAASCDKAIGQTINIGRGSEISVGELAEKIVRLCGSKAKIKTESRRIRPKKSEVERLLADNTLARKLLGWKPQVSMDKGIETTIAWIADNLEKYRPRDYTV